MIRRPVAAPPAWTIRRPNVRPRARAPAAGAVGVEADPERREILDRLRRLLAEDRGGRLPHHPAPGGDRVGEMQGGGVLGGERRGESALGPVTG